jgi:uncharacterized membrane protein YhaH (DUF805 family)
MSFFDAIKSYFKNYANFSGRTSKTTFWWTVLFLVLAGMLVAAIFPGAVEVDHIAGLDISTRNDSIAQNVWSIGTFLPSLALGVRRLQDMGKPGQYLWFALIPVAGWIMLLVWFLQPGLPTANKYGEPEKKVGEN